MSDGSRHAPLVGDDFEFRISRRQLRVTRAALLAAHGSLEGIAQAGERRSIEDILQDDEAIAVQQLLLLLGDHEIVSASSSASSVFGIWVCTMTHRTRKRSASSTSIDRSARVVRSPGATSRPNRAAT